MSCAAHLDALDRAHDGAGMDHRGQIEQVRVRSAGVSCDTDDVSVAEPHTGGLTMDYIVILGRRLPKSHDAHGLASGYSPNVAA